MAETSGAGEGDDKSSRGSRRRGSSGAKSRSSRSRTSAAGGTGSTGSTARARAGRSSRRQAEAPPERSVVDVSRDPVIEVSDQETLTAPAAELQALDQDHLQKLAAAHRSRVIKAVVLGVIAALFVAFVLQNARPVNVKLVFGTVTVRMIWVILASAGLGALAGFLVARPEQDMHFHLPERRGKKGQPAKTEPPGRKGKPTAAG